MGQRRGRVLEGEQKGVGEMSEGLAYTVRVRVREGKENVVAAVVVYSGGEVEAPNESHILPRTSELTVRRGQQQVDRGGGWGEKRS